MEEEKREETGRTPVFGPLVSSSPYYTVQVMKALIILSLLVVVLGVVAVGVTHARWEGQPPQIMFNRDFKSLGRTPSVGVTIQDPGTGLKHVSIHLKQKGQDVVLTDDALI